MNDVTGKQLSTDKATTYPLLNAGTAPVVDLGINIIIRAGMNSHLHYDVTINPWGIEAARQGRPGWDEAEVREKAQKWVSAMSEGLKAAGYDAVAAQPDDRDKSHKATLHFLPKGGAANRDDDLFKHKALSIIEEVKANERNQHLSHVKQATLPADQKAAAEQVMPPSSGNGEPRVLNATEALAASRTHTQHLQQHKKSWVEQTEASNTTNLTVGS